MESKEIHHELSVPYSPEQNGLAERLNRTLMESARTMMAHAGLPDCYWAEAIATAAYVRNRMPSRAQLLRMKDETEHRTSSCVWMYCLCPCTFQMQQGKN